MGIQDFQRVTKTAIEIITCDPTTRTIEGKLKDGGTIRVAVWESGPIFVWPRENEVWMVENENGYWKLRHRISKVDATDVPVMNGLSAGDAFIASDRIYTESGDALTTVHSTCRISASSVGPFDQTFANRVSFDNEIWDTDEMSDVANNQIIFKTAGYYQVSFKLIWAVNGTGNRAAFLKHNYPGWADIVVEDWRPNNGGIFGTVLHGSALMRASVDDYLTLECWQNSGGNLNLDEVRMEAGWISAI